MKCSKLTKKAPEPESAPPENNRKPGFSDVSRENRNGTLASNKLILKMNKLHKS